MLCPTQEGLIVVKEWPPSEVLYAVRFVYSPTARWALAGSTMTLNPSPLAGSYDGPWAGTKAVPLSCRPPHNASWVPALRALAPENWRLCRVAFRSVQFPYPVSAAGRE